MKSFENQAIYPAAELHLIAAFMQQKQVKPTQWLMGSGLSEQMIHEANTPISLKQFDIIYRNVFRLSDEPDIGLQFGLALNLSRWGVLAMAMLCERSVGYALELSNKFQALVRSRFKLSPKRVDDQIRINIAPHGALAFPVNAQFGYEMLVGSLQTLISDLRAEPFHFNRIDLNYRAPNYAKQYEQRLNCEIRFGQKQPALWLPSAVLEQRLPLANPIAVQQAKTLCSEEVERIEQSMQGDIRWQVHDILALNQKSTIKLDDVAAELELSPRTFRRRLQESGTSFREQLSEHAMQKALHALSDHRLPLTEVAVLCGFQNATSFREAFRRWTNMTPSAYRKQFEKS